MAVAAATSGVEAVKTKTVKARHSSGVNEIRGNKQSTLVVSRRVVASRGGGSGIGGHQQRW